MVLENGSLSIFQKTKNVFQNTRETFILTRKKDTESWFGTPVENILATFKIISDTDNGRWSGAM